MTSDSKFYLYRLFLRNSNENLTRILKLFSYCADNSHTTIHLTVVRTLKALLDENLKHKIIFLTVENITIYADFIKIFMVALYRIRNTIDYSKNNQMRILFF